MSAASANVGPGYRQLHPLHILYVSSQMYEGIDYVRYRRKTVRLVTFMIGMEDLRLCEETTADHCAAASERDVMLRHLRKNVSNALWRLRRGASYHGQIVVVTYYSLNYKNPTITQWTREVNAALVRGAKPHGVRVADGFRACAAICGSLVATPPAGAAPSAPPPVGAGSRYIALGGSVSFGYREAANLPVPTYNKAHSFVGYPEIVAKDLGLKLNNGSGPGRRPAA